MRNVIPKKLTIMLALVLAGMLLHATTVILTIDGVYSNQGDIQVLVVAATPFGENANATITPTVQWCGRQTYVWNGFPFQNCNATFIVTQGTRTVSQSRVWIWEEAPWANPYFKLPSIPNLPHPIHK